MSNRRDDANEAVCCTPESPHTPGAVAVIVVTGFLSISFIWFMLYGWSELKGLNCPAPWHIWMLAQFLVLLGVCSFYLYDHYRHYRSEMLGRYEEDPDGGHGVLPFGRVYALIWTLTEFVLAMYVTGLAELPRFCARETYTHISLLLLFRIFFSARVPCCLVSMMPVYVAIATRFLVTFSLVSFILLFARVSVAQEGRQHSRLGLHRRRKLLRIRRGVGDHPLGAAGGLGAAHSVPVSAT